MQCLTNYQIELYIKSLSSESDNASFAEHIKSCERCTALHKQIEDILVFEETLKAVELKNLS